MHPETRYTLDYREATDSFGLICRFLMHFFGKDILPDSRYEQIKIPPKLFAICSKPMARFMNFFYECAGENSGAQFDQHLIYLRQFGKEGQDQYPLSLMIPLVFESVPDNQRLQMAMSLHKRLAVYHPGATDCLLGGMEYIVCGDVHPVEHLVRHILGRYQSLLNMGLTPGLMSMFSAEISVFLSLQGLEPNWNAVLGFGACKDHVPDRDLFPLVLLNSLYRETPDVLEEIRSHFLAKPNPSLSIRETWLFGLTAEFLGSLSRKSQQTLAADSLLGAFLIWIFALLFPARLKARL